MDRNTLAFWAPAVVETTSHASLIGSPDQTQFFPRHRFVPEAAISFEDDLMLIEGFALARVSQESIAIDPWSNAEFVCAILSDFRQSVGEGHHTEVDSLAKEIRELTMKPHRDQLVINHSWMNALIQRLEDLMTGRKLVDTNQQSGLSLVPSAAELGDCKKALAYGASFCFTD